MTDLPPVEKHDYQPKVSFDGGELDCGNGLLLLNHKHQTHPTHGELLQVEWLESSVEADLPAWCRLTKNDLVSWCKHGKQRSFLICKGKFDPSNSPNARSQDADPRASTAPTIAQKPASAHAATPAENFTPAPSAKAFSAPSVPVPAPLPISVPIPTPAPCAVIPPLAVMGIGSWPRPRWLLESLHELLEGRICEAEFNHTADDAVRLAVDSQLRAGVDVITDGEQRRDNYASFVGRILENCQLIPLSDLLTMVDDPDKFAEELKSLDVPADQVRHPVVFGKLTRSRPLVLNEARYLKTLTEKPIKIALPGPYLLTRTMWLDCITDRAYGSRELLAADIVRILREEIADLLAEGISLIQLDEPVLSEVAFGQQENERGHATHKRTFMCGALSERGSLDEELAFACDLLNQVTQGLPTDRLAMHICRGNWTPDESLALSGSYDPLLPLLQSVNVGTLFLEFCTSRAGDIEIIRQLPANKRIGVGVVNQKNPRIETIDQILHKAQAALALIGAERLLLTPDCGFATFADNPVASSQTATAKLNAIAAAAASLRSG